MRALITGGLACILALNFMSCESSDDYEVYNLPSKEVISSVGDEDANPNSEDGPK